MEVKHTPGPWSVVETKNEAFPQTWWSEIQYSDGCVIGEIYHDDQEAAEARANACLIAAAPDLLAVSLAICDAADLAGTTLNGPLAKMARAAVAKATGS